MSNLKDRAHKGGTKTKEFQCKEQIVCPVCKKVIPECDLPDKEGIITDNVYYKSGIRIVNSHVKVYCKFEHMHDEQENVLDESHGLIAVVKTHFDEVGKCTVFDIVEILEEQKGGD